MPWRHALALPLILCAAGACEAAPQYRVTDLPTVPGGAESSVVTGLNTRQQAVGWFTSGSQVLGFVTEGGQARPVGDLGGGWVEGIAVNDTGVIVGTARTARQVTHAFRQEGGSLVDLDAGRLFERSAALAINTQGSTVGWATFAGVTGMRAAVFTAGGPVSLGSLDADPLSASWSLASDVNDADQVVGRSLVDGNSSQPRAFLYENGQMRNIGEAAGSVASWATAINSRGWVTGVLDMGGAGHHSFLFDGNQLTDLGTLTGRIGTADAFDINARGDIVGGGFVNGRNTAFLYQGGQMRDLNELVDALDNSYLAQATAINDSGVIAAQACRVDFAICRPVLLTPLSAVPEPASAVLWGLGAMGLGLVRRRSAAAAPRA